MMSQIKGVVAIRRSQISWRLRSEPRAWTTSLSLSDLRNHHFSWGKNFGKTMDKSWSISGSPQKPFAVYGYFPFIAKN
jgi:hypothetical protein